MAEANRPRRAKAARHQLALDDDALSALLAAGVDDDYELVGLMRVDMQWARAVGRVLAQRHGLELRQLQAYVAALQGRSVFVTGGGGVGKSYVTRLVVAAARLRFRARNADAVAVVAPTALAAANVGGQTLDRFVGSRKLRLPAYPVDVVSREEARAALRQQQGGDDGGLDDDGDDDEQDPGFVAPGRLRPTFVCLCPK